MDNKEKFCEMESEMDGCIASIDALKEGLDKAYDSMPFVGYPEIFKIIKEMNEIVLHYEKLDKKINNLLL